MYDGCVANAGVEAALDGLGGVVGSRRWLVVSDWAMLLRSLAVGWSVDYGAVDGCYGIFPIMEVLRWGFGGAS